MSKRLGKFGIEDTGELNMRASRIGERTKDIEDRALTDLLTRTNRMFHRRMKLWRKHKTNAHLLDSLRDLLSSKFEVDSKSGEDIRTSALGGCGAVPVLGNFSSCACKDERRGSRDVERVCAIAACADDVIHRFICIQFDFDSVGSHGSDGTCNFGNGLTFHAKRDQIGTDLRGCGLAGHDDVHGLFSFSIGEVSTVDGFGNKWLEHGLFSF